MKKHFRLEIVAKTCTNHTKSSSYELKIEMQQRIHVSIRRCRTTSTIFVSSTSFRTYYNFKIFLRIKRTCLVACEPLIARERDRERANEDNAITQTKSRKWFHEICGSFCCYITLEGEKLRRSNLDVAVRDWRFRRSILTLEECFRTVTFSRAIIHVGGADRVTCDHTFLVRRFTVRMHSSFISYLSALDLRNHRISLRCTSVARCRNCVIASTGFTSRFEFEVWVKIS